MTPQEASAAIAAAVTAATGRATLEVDVSLPGPGGGGDYASAAALAAADTPGSSSAVLAARVAECLATQATLASVDVTGPGFLALTLTPAARRSVLLAAAVHVVDRYNAGPAGASHVEFDLGTDVTRYRRARQGGTGVLDRPRWRRADASNPTYAVQLAHARCRSWLLDTAVETETSGSCLFGLLATWPRIAGRAPSHRAAHLERVAAAVEELRPPADRLLVETAAAVLAAGLAGLGVSAPERM